MTKMLMKPKQAALADMRACGLDVSVLKYHRTIIVEEIEEFTINSNVFSRRIRRTIITD